MEVKSNTEGQVSTKELFQQVFTFFDLIFKNWKVWTSALLIGTIISLILDLSQKETKIYIARTIFNLELGGGGGGNGISGLANAFGIGGNAAAGGELFTSQNFPILVTSEAVVERALMSTVEVGGDSLLMINFMADSSSLKTKEWSGDLFHAPNWEAINYDFVNKPIKEFTPTENRVMNLIYAKIRDVTDVATMAESNSIMGITAQFSNEMLCKIWTELLLKSTEEFYVEMKTKKTRDLLKQQRGQLVKIKALLDVTDRKLARSEFEQSNVVNPRGIMETNQLRRESNFLSNQYIRQLNSIDELERVLIAETPIFTIISESRLPLLSETESKGMRLKISSLAFFFLSLVGIFLKDFYSKIMI